VAQSDGAAMHSLRGFLARPILYSVLIGINKKILLTKVPDLIKLGKQEIIYS